MEWFGCIFINGNVSSVVSRGMVLRISFIEVVEIVCVVKQVSDWYRVMFSMFRMNNCQKCWWISCCCCQILGNSQGVSMSKVSSQWQKEIVVGLMILIVRWLIMVLFVQIRVVRMGSRQIVICCDIMWVKVWDVGSN